MVLPRRLRAPNRRLSPGRMRAVCPRSGHSLRDWAMDAEQIIPISNRCIELETTAGQTFDVTGGCRIQRNALRQPTLDKSRPSGIAVISLRRERR